jgi:uncharacterized membrane protein
METLFIMAAVVVGIAFLLGPVLAIVAYSKGHGLERRLSGLERQIGELRGLRTGPPAPGETTPAPDSVTLKRPAEPEKPPAEPEQPASEPTEVPPAEPAPEPAPPEAADAAAAMPGRTTPWAAATPKPALEERLTSRWLVWLGGIALALGGGFLVKVSIDVGLLGPTARCTLGFLLGLILTAGGEWLRRRPAELRIAAISPSAVPPALTAAGICILFASIYAAYGLYGLIPPLFAFLLLALTALAAVGLSLLQGPFVGLLGLLGGFANPLLVSTGQPSALTLFPYLLILVGGSLAVARAKTWRWMDWSALAGAVLWTLFWYAQAWQRADSPVVALFLLVLAVLFVTAHHGLWAMEEGPTAKRWWSDIRLDNVVVAAAAAVALLALLLVRLDRYEAPSLLLLGAIAAFYLFYLVPAQGEALGFAPGPILPPEFLTFVTTSALLAALFGFGGFWALWGARRPGFWAAIAATVPLAALANAYWRIEAFEIGLPWAIAGLALAALYLGVLRYIMAYETDSALQRDVLKGAIGAFAVGVVAAISLAATMTLREEWLTVALAAQLPAMAWISAKLNLRALRGSALVVAIVVLVRLVLNENILNYGPIETPFFNWLLYGYGLPAVAFYGAMVMFRRKADDRLVMLLEAGALTFVVLLVTLQIHQFFTGGRLGTLDIGLAEHAAQIIAWLAIALGLYRLQRGEPRPVLLWSWRLLAVWGSANLLLGPVLLSNPLLTPTAVGDWPVLNLLALAYGAPALIALIFAHLAQGRGESRLALLAGGLGFLLVFIELTLEIRHAFHGRYLHAGATGDLEWYCYSLGWLIYAGLLLGLGIIRRQAALRYAALGMILLTIAKVFLLDMAELPGVYRALSFLGLGASLVGVGFLYRRFVFPVGPTPSGEPPAESERPVG